MNTAAITYDGENKYIRITDIDEQSSQYISDSPVSPAGQLLDKYIVEENDILFARTGASTGKTYLYKKKDGKLYFAGFLIRAKIKTECNSTFIFAQTKTVRYYKWVGFMSIRSGQPGINSQEYASYRFLIPQKEEQDKIAKFLSLLDSRIEAQIKIIDKLQSLIKELIDALLENPSWEKAYLSSFMHFFSTNSLSWKQLSYTEGEIRNLHYGLIHGFQTRGIDTAFLPKILQSFVPKQYTLCQAGDVAFADASEDTNEIGKAIEFISTIDSETVCGLHTIHGRDIKNKTLIGFKGYVFNSRYFHDQVRRLAQGTKVFSITANNLSSCFVYIPELAKQKNIVNLLNAYEELLSTNKMLLKQYEIQKSYLLQQMFI
ncbi:restriction endonuclease subunit S [Bacteroides ovatus]|nr:MULTISPECIES: restriction endonuclease subunit S [Bacteroides]MDC2697274.1 restriction endonuclease subunit S [Bacteroides ovatus]